MDLIYEIAAHVLSFALIIAYSVRFFNQPLYNYSEISKRHKDFILPVEPRLMTEYHAYKFFRSIFTALLVFVYVVLFIILSSINSEDLEGMAKAVVSVFGTHKEFTSFASMLAVIGVTQYPKWLNTLVSNLRGVLHEQALIPLKGSDLFDKLLHVRINYDLPEAKVIIKRLIIINPLDDSEPRQDIKLEDFKIQNRKDIIWKWAKLSYLLHCVDDSVTSRTKRYFDLENKLGYLSLKHEYIELLDDVVDYQKNKLTWKKDRIDALREDVRRLIYRACRLIACMLILTADPRVDPIIWLKKHAYEVVVETRQSLKRGAVLFSLFVVTFSTFVFMVLAAIGYCFFYDGGFNLTIVKLFSYNAYVFIMMILPLAYIIYMKGRLSIVATWPSVLTDKDAVAFKDRQWLIYFGLGFIGWMATNVIASLFAYLSAKYGLSEGGDLDFGEIIEIMWPFTFISFVTIVFSAYRLDTVPMKFRQDVSQYSGYLLQGVLQGTLIAIVVKVGFIIAGPSIGHAELAPLSFYYLLAFIAGFSVSLAFQLSNDCYEDVDSQNV